MKSRVPLWGNPQKSVEVERGATAGATVGVDVRNPDGSLWTPTAVGAAGTIKGAMSIVVSGGGTAILSGDVPSPGALKSYATNSLGVRGWYNPALFESTGLLSVVTGPILAINSGDNTKFDFGVVLVGMTDYSVNAAQPTRTPRVIGPFTAQSVTGLLVQPETFVGADVVTGLLVQQATPFTNTQARTIVPMGVLVHTNLTNLNAVNQLPNVMRAGISQLYDHFRFEGHKGKDQFYAANGANLQINRTAGSLWVAGGNVISNPLDPNLVPVSAASAISFRYRNRGGETGGDVSSIDPSTYDNAGTTTAVPSNDWTAQRLYIFPSALTRIQRGQATYPNLAAALAGFPSEPFVVEGNLSRNGVFRGWLLVKEGATDLSNPAQAKFVPADTFGNVASSGVALANTDQLAEGTTNLYFTDARALSAAGAVTNTAILTPAQIVANTDDYAPTNHATTHKFRLSTDASRNLTGLQGGANGREIVLTNVGAFDLVLTHDATSTAANRFLLPNSANLTLNPNDSVRCWYDGTSSRWRAVGY